MIIHHPKPLTWLYTELCQYFITEYIEETSAHLSIYLIIYEPELNIASIRIKIHHALLMLMFAADYMLTLLFRVIIRKKGLGKYIKKSKGGLQCI